MQPGNEAASRSKARIWTGRILSALPVLFLLLDAVFKFFKPAPVIEATTKMGYSLDTIIPLGVVLLACTVLYIIPSTAILGAILLTGYLGGAVASHVRVGEGWFPILFPIIIGVLLWGGIYLRDDTLRNLIPFRRGGR